VTAFNVWGANGLLSRRTGTTSVYYTFDPQGSVVQRLDANENILSTSAYDAWGNPLVPNPNDPFGYDAQWGYYTDNETGLLLLTHRYYDPTQGRFLTRDTVGYAGGVNLYGYVGNGVVGYADLYGYAQWLTVGRRWWLPWYYQHAYIKFIKMKCIGHSTFGFWPHYSKSVACDGAGSGSTNSLLNSSTGSSCSLCGLLQSSIGDIRTPDPDSENNSGEVDREINDITFEKALCSCIQDSMKHPPEYSFGRYVCGSWVSDMWSCAERKTGHPD